MRRASNARMAIVLSTCLFASVGLGASAAPAASEIVGDWLGALDTGSGSLHVVFHLTQDKDGGLTGTMDSPDQGATGILLSSATYTSLDLHLAIERIGGTYDGKFDKERRQIVGVWKQGPASLPLTLGPAGK